MKTEKINIDQAFEDDLGFKDYSEKLEQMKKKTDQLLARRERAETEFDTSPKYTLLDSANINYRSKNNLHNI